MKISRIKITIISMAALMAVSPLLAESQVHTVNAADSSVRKTVMHTAIAYDKNGKSTGVKYYAYRNVNVDANPVTINGSQYYKISNQDQYIKVTNIDGVRRKITHNTYIYRSSSRRTSFNGRWKLYKGETITTYGGSYKFKNGKRYFRVGGPRKQYVKSFNLGSIIGTNASTNNSTTSTNANEATVTVKYSSNVNIYDNQGKVVQKNVPKGTKFVVDRLEKTSFSDRFIPQWANGGFYRIKGTDHWIVAVLVTADKKLPLQDPARESNLTNYSYITFPKDTDVYNANGTMQNHNGQKISQQLGHFKVDKLMYIWVPNENKAELFYHLVGNSFYASVVPNGQDKINVGNDAYVKAADVKYVEGIKLTPSNTAAEAEAAAKK